MRRLFNRCTRYYAWLCYGLSAVFGGLYILIHSNYLDYPQITPPPISNTWLGIIDDWWLGLILLLIGIVLVSGVVLDTKLLRDVGLALLSFPYALLCFGFAQRGLFDLRFNLTWLFAGLTWFLMLGLSFRRTPPRDERGDLRERF